MHWLIYLFEVVLERNIIIYKDKSKQVFKEKRKSKI